MTIGHIFWNVVATGFPLEWRSEGNKMDGHVGTELFTTASATLGNFVSCLAMRLCCFSKIWFLKHSVGVICSVMGRMAERTVHEGNIWQTRVPWFNWNPDLEVRSAVLKPIYNLRPTFYYVVITTGVNRLVYIVSWHVCYPSNYYHSDQILCS